MEKIKFTDFGRCLVCLHNPCSCHSQDSSLAGVSVSGVTGCKHGRIFPPWGTGCVECLPTEKDPECNCGYEKENGHAPTCPLYKEQTLEEALSQKDPVECKHEKELVCRKCAEAVGEEGITQKDPVEKPRCKKCNAPFQRHHKVWTVQDVSGFYHTSCRPSVAEKDPVEKHFNECPMNEFFGDKDKPCTCPAENVQSWGERFDKEFRTGEKAWHPNYVLIKQFISTEIQRAYERGREEKAPMGVSQWLNYGEKWHYADFWKKELISQALASERTKLRVAVEGLRRKEEHPLDFGFNTALDKVKDLLK